MLADRTMAPQRPEQRPEQEQFLTVKEAARLLRVSERTMRKHLAAGRMPGARRFGALWRIRRAAVEEMFAE